MPTTQSVTICTSCGSRFTQDDDPGRRREYCSNACRQRAYRARTATLRSEAKASARAEKERQEREAEARRAEDARRARERRAKQQRAQQNRPEVPRWMHVQYSDGRLTRRRLARALHAWQLATHASTEPHERQAAERAVESIRNAVDRNGRTA